MGQIDQPVHSLLSWASTDTNLLPPPPSGYTQLAAALDACDVKIVLTRLSKMLPPYYNSVDHAAAIDLIATMVVCLDESSLTKRLADALSLEQQNLLPLLKRNETLLAEDIVRLNRRVKLLSIVVVQQDIPVEDVVTTLMPELTEADMQNVQSFPDQDASESAAQQEDGPQDIDQMLDAAAAMGNLTQDNSDMGGNMDDLYLDLDTGDMDLVNFDDLDMEGMF